MDEDKFSEFQVNKYYKCPECGCVTVVPLKPQNPKIDHIELNIIEKHILKPENSKEEN
jgi:hypothetical protein